MQGESVALTAQLNTTAPVRAFVGGALTWR